jgi:putative transposase
MPAHSINIKNRRSIRLPKYDYRECGFYFVTVCAWEREHLFGSVVDGQMQLNEIGRVVEEEWFRSSEIRKEIEMDEFVVMPNHIHGILVIKTRRGMALPCPQNETDVPLMGTAAPCPYNRCGRPRSGSLGAIIGQFKSAASKRINTMRQTPGFSLWQRNYYERIIRNENELLAIRQYIRDNPFNWDHDPDNLP